MKWQRYMLAALAGSFGCTFNSEASTGSANTIGVDGSTGTTGGPVPMSTKGPGEAGAEASGNDSSGAGVSGALLRFRGFDEHDFGNVGPATGEGTVLTVVNNGDEAATQIMPSALDPPFRFQGVAYPGAGATCAETLAPQEECTVALMFAPDSYGQYDGELSLTYEGGGEPATVTLRGTSAGQSANLLVNGDGEAGGDPPMAWTNITGSWESLGSGTGAEPHNGELFIFGGQMNGTGIARLRQTVPLQAFADVIDTGDLDYQFHGWARSLNPGNDPHAVELVFFADGGQELDAADLGLREQAAWMAYDDGNPIPSGTRSMAVDLVCHKETGNACSGLFDDLSLTVVFVAR